MIDTSSQPRPTRSTRRRRGQAGLTLIEVLIVVALSGIIIGPVFGLLTLTMKVRKPVATMNNQASQLRLFRSYLARDWAEAKIVSTAPTWPYVECSGPGYGVGTIRLVLVSSDALPRRVIYKTRPNADGTVDIVRRECEHRQTLDYFGFGGRTDAVGGSDRAVVRKVSSLSVPAACNPTGEPPFAPCDMNVTLTAVDGQVTTLRLHQETGRES